MGHGGVDVRQESIREETIKWCVCDGEIHIWMKETSVQIIECMSACMHVFMHVCMYGTWGRDWM